MAYPNDTGVSYTTNVDNVDVIYASDVNNLQTEVSSIKTLLGIIGSVVSGTFYYLMSEITGADKAVGKTATQTLTNKTIAFGSNTISATLAQLNAAISDADISLPSTTETLTNKTISLGSNTVSMTLAQLNTAVSDADVATIAGNETLTNKTLTTPTISKPVMSATNPTAQTYTPSAGGTATLDLSLSNQHRITMPAGNITVALSNDTNSQIFTLSITQDGTGSRTVTWFSTIKWPGGTVPTLTTTANKRDQFVFIRTGSGTYDGFVVGQNL
jgi:hypothetical protein